MTRAVVLIAVALGVASAGCNVSTGLNRECVLVRKCDAGACPITEQYVQDKLGSSKDFIAFGAVECEDLVCVRDSAFPKGTDLAGPAKGYCSKPCAAGSQCQSDDRSLDDKPATALYCRPLLLDEFVLAEIRKDPAAAKLLGNVTSPFFCARTGLDGGT